MAKEKFLPSLARWLLFIGGINWGLNVFGYNLVTMLLGRFNYIWTQAVYITVGVSALMLGWMHAKEKKWFK